MKQILFPILLVIALTLFSLFSEHKITSECDELISLASEKAQSTELRENWEEFSKFAAFITPYDLIRTADSNFHEYLQLLQSHADEADVAVARDVYISSVRQIRRIHSTDWELIF